MHTNLQLSNIFLTKDKKLKLKDFGTNKIYDKFNIEMENTFQNLPPEMCTLKDNENLGDKYDKSGDIWALGILMFEMLHGYLPFKTNSLD